MKLYSSPLGSLLALAAGVITAAAGSVFTVDLTTSFTGATVPIVIASVLGTIAGISLGDPIEPRRKLFGHAFGYTVIAVAGTSFIPWILHWTIEPAKLAGFAIILSASMRKLWPAFSENLVPWLINRFSPFKKKE